jgi:hypothetical protein
MKVYPNVDRKLQRLASERLGIDSQRARLRGVTPTLSKEQKKNLLANLQRWQANIELEEHNLNTRDFYPLVDFLRRSGFTDGLGISQVRQVPSTAKGGYDVVAQTRIPGVVLRIRAEDGNGDVPMRMHLEDKFGNSIANVSAVEVKNLKDVSVGLKRWRRDLPNIKERAKKHYNSRFWGVKNTEIIEESIGL